MTKQQQQEYRLLCYLFKSKFYNLWISFIALLNIFYLPGIAISNSCILLFTDGMQEI